MLLYFRIECLVLRAFLNRTALLNQNPEQLALDEIDKQLLDCGWIPGNSLQTSY